MQRLLAIIALMAFSAGCQAENPFAFFGPSRVPAPGAQSQAPYYPPTSSGATQPIGSTAVPATSPLAKSAPATSRPSVSVDSTSPVSSGSSFVTDAQDREPIRIVENPSPAARTATAPPFGNGSAPTGNVPSTISPPPPQNGNRGYTTPSTSGKMSGNYRRDPSVAPAGYEQSLTPQVSGSTGQWRAR